MAGGGAVRPFTLALLAGRGAAGLVDGEHDEPGDHDQAREAARECKEADERAKANPGP